jgi:hypothetical protein
MGGNYCFRGLPSTGKTLGMVGFIWRLIYIYGYKWSDVVTNFHLFLNRGKGTYENGFEGSVEPEGYRHMDNEHIKLWVRKVYRKSKGKITRQIIAIDEIDQVYSHKFPYSDESTSDILTLWQDQKLENFFLYTKHVGRGCNILIRQATEVSIRPMLIKPRDTLYLRVIDGNDQQNKILPLYNVHEHYNHYWRWEPCY